MEDNLAILIVTLVVLGYGYFSKTLSNLNISGPMVFTIIGVLLSPLAFSIASPKVDSSLVQTIAEIALVIVLFSDASTLNLKKVKLSWGIPSRLLFIGLPITILFSTYVGHLLFPEISIMYILLMALVLAPTDAALGKAVVLDEQVPEKIRSSINIESGLNDGIVFPALITVVAIIAHGQTGTQDNSWVSYIAQQIIFGAVIGAAVGYLNALIAKRRRNKEGVEASYRNLIPMAVAIIAYYAASYFGGNGFIAAFFSGLFLGNYNEALKENIENFVETESELLILISFLVFGVTFIPDTIAFWDAKVFLYAVMSLTVLRMLPVAISLIGTKLDTATVLFIGWFGPRGIASVLYVLIILEQLISIQTHETVYAVITVTVMLSILLHGLSARPLASLYGKSHKDV